MGVSNETDSEIEASVDDTDLSKPIELKDPNVVDWDGPDDPANPLNWPASHKNIHVAIVSIFTLTAYVISKIVIALDGNRKLIDAQKPRRDNVCAWGNGTSRRIWHHR